MKTLIINGSPRKNGNTVTLLNELKKHLRGEVYQIDTYYAKSSPCFDCRHCVTHAECIIKDEMQDAYKMMDEADNIASRLQYFWVKEGEIEPAIFTGKDLLKKPRAECCEILHWPDADGDNQPSAVNKNRVKMAELADKLNTR